jgi:outer membrane protein
MKFLLWIITGLCLASIALADDVKIGYVDLQRALNESDAGKRAKEEFKGEVDKLQGKLKKEKDAIDGLKEQLEKKALVVKEEEKGNLEEEYRKRLRDFERTYKDSQADLQKRDNELTGAIIKELQEIIRDYGDKQGYTIILETSSSAVLYGAKSADVTEAIIQQYNGRRKK